MKQKWQLKFLTSKQGRVEEDQVWWRADSLSAWLCGLQQSGYLYRGTRRAMCNSIQINQNVIECPRIDTKQCMYVFSAEKKLYGKKKPECQNSKLLCFSALSMNIVRNSILISVWEYYEIILIYDFVSMLCCYEWIQLYSCGKLSCTSKMHTYREFLGMYLADMFWCEKFYVFAWYGIPELLGDRLELEYSRSYGILWSELLYYLWSCLYTLSARVWTF